jgi:thioredoxin reductase (NADPH)
VGAGVAGVSCALWLDTFGVPMRWVDLCGRVGGTLHRIRHDIMNYPGLAAMDGAALAARLSNQVERRALRLESAFVEAIDIHRMEAHWGESSSAHPYVVLATGTSPKRLGLSGERELWGRLVFGSSHQAAEHLRARPVLVVGEGDGAFEGALILARAGSKVLLAHRSEKVRRARLAFREAVASCAEISVHASTQIVAWEESARGIEVELQSVGKRWSIELGAVVLKLGVRPNLPSLIGQLERDERGFIRVDCQCQSSAAGVFAIGDVTAQPLQCIALAAAQGAAAASCIARRLGLLFNDYVPKERS